MTREVHAPDAAALALPRLEPAGDDRRGGARRASPSRRSTPASRASSPPSPSARRAPRSTAWSWRARYLRGHYDWRKLRQMLRYGLPLIPGLVALWATAYADRILLANLEDLDAVGLYAIAARFAAPVRAAADGLRHRLPPVPAVAARRGSRAGARSARPDRHRSTAVALLGVRPAARGLRAGARSTIVTPGYDDAAAAISPLVLGTAAYGVASVFWLPLLIHRRTDVSAGLTFVMGVANVGAVPRADPALRPARAPPSRPSAATRCWRSSTGGGDGGSTTRRTSPAGSSWPSRWRRSRERPGASTSTPGR